MEEGTPEKSWTIVFDNQLQPFLSSHVALESIEGGRHHEHHANINRQWK